MSWSLEVLSFKVGGGHVGGDTKLLGRGTRRQSTAAMGLLWQG